MSLLETLAPAALTVSQVAQISGVTDSAVRFYDKHGLIQAVRTGGNQRRFTETAPCRIKVARVAQRLGLTVREIVEVLADLPDDPTEEDWAVVGRELVTEAEKRISQLHRALADLGSSPRLCEIDLPESD